MGVTNRAHSTHPRSRLYFDIPRQDAPVIYTGAFPILTAQPGRRSIYNTISTFGSTLQTPNASGEIVQIFSCFHFLLLNFYFYHKHILFYIFNRLHFYHFINTFHILHKFRWLDISTTIEFHFLPGIPLPSYCGVMARKLVSQIHYY